jgi:hypothetical protein
LFLKQQWDAGKAKQEEIAADDKAAATPVPAAAAAAPQPTRPAQLGPNPLERGPYRDQGPRGPLPPPPRR